MWIERRTDVVDIFPDRAALVRLVGAVLAEQQDVWTEMRRYIGLDILAKSRQAKITDPYPTVISMTAIDPAMATAIGSGRRRQAVTPATGPAHLVPCSEHRFAHFQMA